MKTADEWKAEALANRLALRRSEWWIATPGVVLGMAVFIGTLANLIGDRWTLPGAIVGVGGGVLLRLSQWPGEDQKGGGE